MNWNGSRQQGQRLPGGGACRPVSEPTPGWPALGAPDVAGAGGTVDVPVDGDADGDADGGGTVGDVPAGAGDVDMPPLLAPPLDDCA